MRRGRDGTEGEVTSLPTFLFLKLVKIEAKAKKKNKQKTTLQTTAIHLSLQSAPAGST